MVVVVVVAGEVVAKTVFGVVVVVPSVGSRQGLCR